VEVFKRAFNGPVTIDTFEFSEDEDSTVDAFDLLSELFIRDGKTDE